MVNLTIDGKNVQVPEGTTVLRAAEGSDIHIPTLCDHPALKPLGGCRLCLVEVEGMRTLQTSCTLPVGEKMIVRTNTPKVNEARKFVLSMIFSERNHFCPYCQVSGGDCELQNAALDEQMSHWPLMPNWQSFGVDASHSYFVLDQNRCILCQRCIRACGDLVGNYTLGLEERGAQSLLVADWGIPLGESSCISCGTCTQVCPTGALINRRSSYQGHDNQTDGVESVCINCSVGCSIVVHNRDNRLVRIDGNWDGTVNGGLLCKNGRFVPMEEDRERIKTPLVRKDGKLQPVSWDEALSEVVKHLKPLAGKNGSSVAAIASTRLPAEDLSLFQQIFAEGMGSKMVTSMEEGRPTELTAKLAADLGGPFEGRLSELSAADCVFSIGEDLSADHQVAGFFIKRNIPNDNTQLVMVYPEATGLDFNASTKITVPAESYLDVLKGLKAALSKLGLSKNGAAADAEQQLQQAAVKTGTSAETYLQVAEVLGSAKHPVFIYGKPFVGDASMETLMALVDLARSVGALDAGYAGMLNMKGKANSQSAVQYGLDQLFTLNGQQAVYVALGDDQPSKRLIERVEKAPYLVVQASYQSDLTNKANVVLPVEIWVELEGHYLNLEGRLQKANKVLQAPEGVRSNTAVLSAVASGLGFAPDGNWKERLLRRVSAVTISEN
jgi:formate dehydrogenase major subunit